MANTVLNWRALIIALLVVPAASLAEPPEPDEDVLDLDQVEDTTLYTPHNSILNHDGLDEALIGSWRLQKAVLTTPQFQRPWPSAGRLLTILANGDFSENYSSEHFLPGAAGAGISLPGGMQSCAQTAVFSGSSTGNMKVEPGFDLDSPDDQGNYPVNFYIEVERTGGVKPLIICPGASVDASTSAVSPPLGTGRVSSGQYGMRVGYTYVVNQDWKILTLTTVMSPTIRYTFTREAF